MGFACCSELPGKLYPCIIRASEGVAFLRSGKPGLVLLIVAKGMLLLLARNSVKQAGLGRISRRELCSEYQCYPLLSERDSNSTKIQGDSNGGSTEEPSVASWQWANVWGCSPLEALGSKALGDRKSERHYRNVKLVLFSP